MGFMQELTSSHDILILIICILLSIAGIIAAVIDSRKHSAGKDNN